MKSPPKEIPVLICGERALFTRPESKVERMSYSVITPSAARGVVEAVAWKPQIQYAITRIVVLNPIRFESIKRNEVSKKIAGGNATTWALHNHGGHDYFADDYRQRQQRHSVVLRDVGYVVYVRVVLTDKAGPDDSITKYREILRRRLEKGQCYHQPYLGCREFHAEVALATGDEEPAAELASQEAVPLGRMLHDIEYRSDGDRRAHFFDAVLRRGVMEVPEFAVASEGGGA